MTQNRYAPQERYNKKTRRRYVINLNKNTDQDIIDYLDQLDNVQGYIKDLIRSNVSKKPMA